MATTTYQVDPLTEARGWISDCWTVDQVDPDDLTDDEVIAAVNRHYDRTGYPTGWDAFLAMCE